MDLSWITLLYTALYAFLKIFVMYRQKVNLQDSFWYFVIYALNFALLVVLIEVKFYNKTPVFKEGPYCKKCCLSKGPNTHHCSRCNICIDKMDHHCIVLLIDFRHLGQFLYSWRQLISFRFCHFYFFVFEPDRFKPVSL